MTVAAETLTPPPELLAPAGDWDAMRAAVANGADAVYFGLDDFNARHRAANFRQDELPQIMAYLHAHNVKGFLTFNTLTFLAGQHFQISPQQRGDLEQTFSRGFTHGFLDGVNHQKLVAARFPKSRGRRIGTVKRVSPQGVIVTLTGLPASAGSPQTRRRHRLRRRSPRAG